MRITGNGVRFTGAGIRMGLQFLPIMRWDSTYLAGDAVIDNNSTSYYDVAPGSFSIISTTAIPSSGTYMYTVRMDYNSDAMVPDVGGYVGVGNRNFNPTTNIGADANSFGFSDDGAALFNGSAIDSGPIWPQFNVNSSKIIDIVVKDHTYIWIRVDGGDWNNNSTSNLADGTGSINFNDIGFTVTELYPMVTVAGDMGPTQFDILSTSPYGVPSGVTFLNMYTPTSSGVTISTADLIGVTSAYIDFGNNSYNNSGAWEYVVFNSPTLYNQFQTLTGGNNTALAVTWANGSTQTSGYVFVENTGNTNEFQFVTVTDPSASTPQPGLFKFPATFTAV